MFNYSLSLPLQCLICCVAYLALQSLSFCFVFEIGKVLNTLRFGVIWNTARHRQIWGSNSRVNTYADPNTVDSWLRGSSRLLTNCLCGRCTTVPYSLSAMFCRTRFFYFRPSPSQIIVFAQQFSTYTSSWVTRPFLSSQLFLRNFYELFPFFTFHFSFLPPDAIMRTTQCLRRQFCPTVETWAMSAARTIDLRTRTSPNELLRIVRWCGKRKRRGNRFPGRRGWWVMDSSSAASRRCHWRRLAVPATDDWWLSVYAKQWCMRRRARRDRINWRFHCTGWPRKRKPLPQSHHHHHHHHHHHLIRWKQIQSKYKYK